MIRTITLSCGFLNSDSSIEQYKVTTPCEKYPLHLLLVENYQSVEGFSETNGSNQAEHTLWNLAGCEEPQVVNRVASRLSSDMSAQEIFEILQEEKIPFITQLDDRFESGSKYQSLPFWGHVKWLIDHHEYKLSDQ